MYPYSCVCPEKLSAYQVRHCATVRGWCFACRRSDGEYSAGHENALVAMTISKAEVPHMMKLFPGLAMRDHQ